MAGPDDEERDDHGRWSGGAGGSTATQQGGLSRLALVHAGLSKSVAARVKTLNNTFQSQFGHSFGKAENGKEWLTANHSASAAENNLAYVRQENDGTVVLGVTASNLTDKEVAWGQSLGWQAPGTGKVEDTIVHEFGHYLLMSSSSPYDNTMLRNALNDAKSATTQSLRDTVSAGGTLTPGSSGSVSQISDYAMQNYNEQMAENFTAYHMGGDARPDWNIAWGNALMTGLGLDPTPLREVMGK